MKNINIPPQIIAYVTGFLIIIWVVYLLLKKIGLVESREEKVKDKMNEEAAKEAVKWFPPNIWKNYPASTAMNSTISEGYAKEIHDSFGWINDDEDKIYSVFQKLVYKQNVSQLAQSYEQLYSADLHAKLFNNLSDLEMQYIYNIIDSKKTS